MLCYKTGRCSNRCVDGIKYYRSMRYDTCRLKIFNQLFRARRLNCIKTLIPSKIETVSFDRQKMKFKSLRVILFASLAVTFLSCDAAPKPARIDTSNNSYKFTFPTIVTAVPNPTPVEGNSSPQNIPTHVKFPGMASLRETVSVQISSSQSDENHGTAKKSTEFSNTA